MNGLAESTNGLTESTNGLAESANGLAESIHEVVDFANLVWRTVNGLAESTNLVWRTKKVLSNAFLALDQFTIHARAIPFDVREAMFAVAQRAFRSRHAIVMIVRSRDTTAAAAALHEQSYRELGMAGRLAIALELSDFTHALAVAGIQRRHPSCSEEEARRRLANLLYGPGTVPAE